MQDERNGVRPNSFFCFLRLTTKDPNKQAEQRPMITLMDGLNSDCDSDGGGGNEEEIELEDV
jgi:hypothetical protein